MSLVIDGISKRFGRVVALDRVSFSVEPGRIFGLLGANGAALWVAARIYSAGVLLYGQRPGVREVWRATRASR